MMTVLTWGCVAVAGCGYLLGIGSIMMSLFGLVALLLTAAGRRGPVRVNDVLMVCAAPVNLIAARIGMNVLTGRSDGWMSQFIVPGMCIAIATGMLLIVSLFAKKRREQIAP